MLFGIFALIWHDFNIWQQIDVFGNIPHGPLAVVAGIVEIAAGFALFIPKTARAGALVLAILYGIFALLWIPVYAQKPTYNAIGNIFEQLSMVSGALMIYAALSPEHRSRRLATIAYYLFAVSVVSFTLEQALYLDGTASFVPKWIPPSGMFWAVATTVFFGLAAVALLIRRYALLAAQLTALMIAGFQVLVWLPAPFAQSTLLSWAGNAENLGILASALIVAGYLSNQAQMGMRESIAVL